MQKRLGEILVEAGYITEEELQRALEVQRQEGHKRRVGEILSEMNLKDEHLLEALALQHRMQIARDADFPPDLPLENLSYEFLKRHEVFPIRLEHNTLYVAIPEPQRADVIEVLEASLGYRVIPLLARREVILRHIENAFASREATMRRVIADVQEDITPESPEELDHLRDLAQEKGIIKLVNLLIENAVRDRASDIHIEPEEGYLRVRYRIDGILHEKEALPLRMHPAVASRIKLMASMNIAERRMPQDGRIEGTFADREIDIRVSTLPSVHGESIVMRLLDRESSFITLENLGFDDHLLRLYQRLIQQPYGMILITGPTGSGKSTTLYASLDRINTPQKKIITIEEPVEYMLKGVTQINVRPKIGLTFATGLRHIVRQDPDIIMVGEIRDLETASIAIHAALTGHLLFSTLHTNDAPGAITRLMDMGVENYLVSSTLIGVVAQRLVRRVCTSCREAYEVPRELREEFGLTEESLYRGRGCSECSGTGYRGRIAIFELLVVNDEIREMIMEKATAAELRERAIALGMRTLRQDGILKATKGITTLDEVLRVTQTEIV